jgi:hypothetical protein
MVATMVMMIGGMPVGSVVVSTRCDDDTLPVAFAFNSVDQPVLTCDASRPEARQIALERFGLANPLERCPARVLNEGVQPFKQLVVMASPIEIVIPAIVAELDPHSET